MRILLVSRGFYPQNSPRSFRTTELVKEFSRLGHEVTVYVPPIDFDYSVFYKKYKNVRVKFTNDSPENKILKANSLMNNISRVLNVLLEYPSIHYYWDLKESLKKETDYDLLISLAAPHTIHWGIGRIYKKRRIAKTWVADCGDPFMLCGTGRKHLFYFKWFEKMWCRLCDFISVPTDYSYLGYYPEFRNKIRIIPQAFNFEDTPLDKYIQNEVPTFCFAGGFIKGVRDPQKLMEFLINYKKPFKFYVFGYETTKTLAPYKELLGDRLEVHEKISREEIIRILSKMDFLINIGNGTKIQTPSKLIDYTLAKRPILTIETNNIKQDILNEFLDGNYEHRDPEIDISRYDIHFVAQQFLDLCKS